MTAPSFYERISQGQLQAIIKPFHTYSWDDIGLGELYAAQFAGKVIYNKQFGWLVYDGKCWQPDEREGAMRLATKLALKMKYHAEMPPPELKRDTELLTGYTAFAKKCQSTEKRRLMLENAKLDLRINVATEELNADPHRVTLANGVYDIADDYFFDEHNEYDLSTRVLPVRYDLNAECPEIDAYLTKVVTPEMVPFLEELSGYLLWPGNHYKKAILLYGPKDSGKSRYLAINRAMLGSQNVSSMTLHTIAENRFAASGLFGMLANIAGDLDSRTVERSDMFMMITGKDTIDTERKYGNDRLRFIPHAKLIFSANEPPYTVNQTEAYLDRWLILPFPNRIPEHEQDPNLDDKLLTQEELSGWLMRSIAGLQRLRKRGYFDPPQVVREAQLRYKDDLDSVRAFIGEDCYFDDRAHVRKTSFYRNYKQWCIDSNRTAQPKTVVYNKMRDDYKNVVTTGLRDGYDCFIGIGLVEAIRFDFPNT